MNYTKLHGISDDWRVRDARVERIPSVVLTPSTIAKRNTLRQSLDKFCTFSWNGINAFDTFGAFVINKNNLKFYNGPGYSNQYTQPLFTDAAGTLTGMKFNTQKISFTIGVYWISEEHYRRLIYWLNPYSIGALVFDFEPMWHYNVKLAGIKDSTRTILGHENFLYKFNPLDLEHPITINKDVPMYYTELTLDFELQGTPEAKYNIPYSFVKSNATIDYPSITRGIWEDVTSVVYPKPEDAALKKVYETFLPEILSETTGNISSDLATPFSVSLPLKFKALTNYTSDLNSDLRILLEAIYTPEGGDQQKITLMDLTIQKLATIFEEQTKNYDDDSSGDSDDSSGDEPEPEPSVAPVYTFSYNSADGLVFLRINGEEEKLLTKLQTLANGQRFVKTLSTSQFQMPGTFDFPNFVFTNFSIRVSFSGNLMKVLDVEDFLQNECNADTILMYAATNLI